MSNKNKKHDDNSELREQIIGRLVNWKFGQALNYVNALKYQDSIKCLKLLDKIWGNTGWDREDSMFGNIINYLVEFIRLNEKWTNREFYNEKEKDVI